MNYVWNVPLNIFRLWVMTDNRSHRKQNVNKEGRGLRIIEQYLSRLDSDSMLFRCIPYPRDKCKWCLQESQWPLPRLRFKSLPTHIARAGFESDPGGEGGLGNTCIHVQLEVPVQPNQVASC